jgi:hypothetical protein
LNTTEPLWSVLETRVSNRFSSPIYLKQLEDGLQEEWQIFRPRLFKTCTSPFQEGLRLFRRQKVVQHHINGEI